jgi:uncharacterized membrane protein (DUF2068 family)
VRENRIIRLIAIFKLCKALLLIVLGVGILRLVHTDATTTLDHWIARLGLDPGNHLVDRAISKVANIPPKRIRELGLGSFIYAALFLTEGIGLWLRKRWAEWFTVVMTASLVPLEVWEVHHHPSGSKIVVLILNLAIVGYLLYRIRTDRAGSRG